MSKSAVIYLRVSTKEQAERGGEAEGFSIPAQRAANTSKAGAIGAQVVAEFVDAGESARKADRPELIRLLEYVAANDVDFCIVHKVDRLSRSRIDDVEISLALTRAGTTLVSATESIDETPSGMLLHGIMSSIAEFYSRNLATEVVKGMSQKAAAGGTPTRAPIGYRHIRTIDDVGREIRTVEVDDTRADLIRWAFEEYATGNWSLSLLAEELQSRGLRTRPTRSKAPRPLGTSNIHYLLRNAYYTGEVSWRGQSYPGRHEPLVERELWDRVQSVLEAHNTAGDRQQQHDHYLRGSVFCSSCGSRLIVTKTTNRQGHRYEYFICIGRHRKRTRCTRRAMPIASVERAVEHAWSRIAMTFRARRELELAVQSRVDQLRARQSEELPGLERRRDALLEERQKLLAAHYANAVPLDLLRTEQQRIAKDLAQIAGRLAAITQPADDLEAELRSLVNLLKDLDTLYINGTHIERRLLNQAVACRILIDDEGQADAELAIEVTALTTPGEVHGASEGTRAARRG